MEAAAQDLLAAAMDVDGVVESEAKEHQGSSMHGSLEKGGGGGGVAADPEMSTLPTTSANKETKNRQSVTAGAACGGAEEDSGTTGSSGYLDVVVVPNQRKRNCDSLVASDSAASLGGGGGGGGGEGEEEAAAAVSQQQQQVLCRLCKRGFSSGAALRGHYFRAHGGGSPSAAAMEDGNARTSNSENGGDKEQQLSSWTTGRGTYLVKNPVASHIHSTGSDLDSCRDDDESSPSLASSRPRPPPPPPPRGTIVSCSRSEAGRLTKKKKRGEVAAAQAESSSPMYQEQQEDEEDMEAEEDQEEEATSVLLGSSSSQATNNMQEVDMEEVTEGTSYMCQICEEEFETAKELNLHKNEHPQYILRMNPKRSQRFIDQDCSDLMGGAAAAAGPTHHHQHHHHHHNHQSKKAAPVSSGKSEDKLISCTECNKKFGSMKALFGHMRCHPERYWRGIQPPDRSTSAQDHAAAAAVAHTHHGSYRRKKRSPPIVLPKAEPESESEMNSKQADAAGKASEVDDSDTESIEAAYINGSSSGRHNNSGPAGGWRTKKRTKRVRQMVRSLQAVAGSAAAAGAPQEEEEEEECPSTPPTEDTQVQKDIVFALMLLHPQRIAQLNPPFLEHKLSKDKDPLMDINVAEKFKGKDNENAACHETEKHHHHHYSEADSKVKKMQQAEVAGGGEDGVVVSNNNQDLDELETQGEQGGGTRMMYQCATCKRIFKSHQALGGHRASHKKVKGCFARTSINDEEESGRQDQSPEDDENKEGISPDEDFVKVEEHNLPLEPQDRSHISVEDAEPCDYLVVAKGDNEEMLNAARKTKGHECSICHRVFNSGQALGGHKRCHWGGAATAGSNEATTTTHNINNKNAMVMATVEQLGLQGFHPIQGLQSVPEKKGIMLEGILDLNMPAPECAEEMVEEQVASASGIMAPISRHSYLPFPTFAIDSAASINNQHPFSDLVVKGTKHMKFQGESLVNQVEKNLEPVASGTSDTVGFRTVDKTMDQEMNHFSSICDRSFTSLEHLSTHQKPHAAIMGPVPGLTV